jgi:hypothetical protein
MAKICRFLGGGFRAAKTPSPSAASGDGIVRAPKVMPRLKVPASQAKIVAAQQFPPRFENF